MPTLDYTAIRRRIHIAQVLALLEFVPARTHGAQVRGPCPLHGSSRATSRSFSAHLEKNAYRCFVCGAAGNQLDLWAAASGLPLYEATLDLCRRLDLEPAPRRRD